MFVNTAAFTEKHSCVICKNEQICKWCTDMKLKQEAVSEIPITKGITPINITVSCDHFERKAQRQDGIFVK